MAYFYYNYKRIIYNLKFERDEKIQLIVVTALAVLLTTTKAYSQESDSTEAYLNKLSLKEVCEFIGIPSDYNSRYDIVILPLCHSGVVLFDGTLNKYHDKKDGISCYLYSGQLEQNMKLKRNLVRNRNLFKDGKLVEGAAKMWVVVD